MAQADSIVVVGIVINNGPGSPILRIVAFDPDGIEKIEVFSKQNANVPVEILPQNNCPLRVQQDLFTFPLGWFPITLRVTDCTNPQNPNPRVDKVHGPFDQDGNIIGPLPPQPEQPKPLPKPPDFEDPTSVNQLPLVLDRTEVIRLLGVSDAELTAIMDHGDLTAFGPGKTRIPRGSLAKFLGL